MRAIEEQNHCALSAFAPPHVRQSTVSSETQKRIKIAMKDIVDLVPYELVQQYGKLYWRSKIISTHTTLGGMFKQMPYNEDFNGNVRVSSCIV